MTHPHIEELLPWYLNGTLGDSERRTVADHLRDCTECVRELDALKHVQAAVCEAAEEAREPSPFLLTRALASIDEYEREKTGARWPWLAWWRPLPQLARVALVAQFAVIIGLGSYLVASRDEPSYVTAAGRVPEGGRARLAVGFQPGASEARIREALQGLGASIVSGPSALGLYTVELPFGPSDAGQVARALQILRENREVVRFAEQAQ